MKKKVVKKSKIKTASTKKTRKKLWYKFLPFKFSILSVTILGCLILVIAGVTNLIMQSVNSHHHVLAAATAGQGGLSHFYAVMTRSGVINPYEKQENLELSLAPYHSTKRSFTSFIGRYGKVVDIAKLSDGTYTIVPYDNVAGVKTNNFLFSPKEKLIVVKNGNITPCGSYKNPCKFTAESQVKKATVSVVTSTGKYFHFLSGARYCLVINSSNYYTVSLLNKNDTDCTTNFPAKLTIYYMQPSRLAGKLTVSGGESLSGSVKYINFSNTTTCNSNFSSCTVKVALACSCTARGVCSASRGTVFGTCSQGAVCCGR